MPGTHDFTEYTYHANGTLAAKTDQRGIVHTYVYDDLNRLTEDRVTDPNNWAAVDGTVQAIVTAYNARGQVESVTSYNSPTGRLAGNVVNQIVYTYNDWGQVATSRQSHDGEVDGSTPQVEYEYDDLARLASVTYRLRIGAFGITLEVKCPRIGHFLEQLARPSRSPSLRSGSLRSGSLVPAHFVHDGSLVPARLTISIFPSRVRSGSLVPARLFRLDRSGSLGTIEPYIGIHLAARRSR